MGAIAPIIGAVASLAGTLLQPKPASPPPPPKAPEVEDNSAELKKAEADKLRAAKRRSAGDSTGSTFLDSQEGNVTQKTLLGS